MSTSDYDRLTLRQMQERRWRLVRPVSTGYMTIPAGREVQIFKKRSGVSITAAPCPFCGVQIRAVGVPFSALEEIVSSKPVQDATT